MRNKLSKIFLITLVVSMILTGCSGGIQEEKKENNTLYVQLHSFNAMTIGGNYITDTYIKDYDLTVVFFWGSWSKISTTELKRYAEFSQKLPKNIGTLNVILDTDKDSTYGACLRNAGIKDMLSIISGDRDFKLLCDQVTEVPTTLFISDEGNVVADPVIGVQLTYDDFEKLYLKEINKGLKETGKQKIKLRDEE